jgi:hypothetical protein
MNRAASSIAALLVFGCFPPGEGLSPPPNAIYYPVGLALDGSAEHLFVANSDFDLQYNAGTLQSWDLAALRARVPRACSADDECAAEERCDLEASDENEGVPSSWCVAREGRHAGLPCGAFGARSAADKLLYPGRCDYIDPTNPQDGGDPILVQSVETGAFATDVIFRARPGGAPDEGRLFVPVRGDATLHWADVGGGRMDCGQGNNDGACDDAHRNGDNPAAENTRDARLFPEPFGVDADEAGGTVIVTNQSSGAVALFVNDWSSDQGPALKFNLGGLPERPIGIAALPSPRAVDALGLDYLPGYLVSFRNSPVVYLLRVYDDAESSPARPYVRAPASASILANSSGFDSRGVAVDGSARRSEELRCAERFGVDDACSRDPACAPAEYQSCVLSAGAIPLDVFVANRAPSSLLVGRTRPAVGVVPTSDVPAFHATVPLPPGPSRVLVGSVIGPTGELERRVFVICFDSRRIIIYDPDRDRVEAEIATGRGPHALSVDPQHGLAYVGHFTDSFLGVVALDQRHPSTYGTMIATVGRPVAPRSAK